MNSLLANIFIWTLLVYFLRVDSTAIILTSWLLILLGDSRRKYFHSSLSFKFISTWNYFMVWWSLFQWLFGVCPWHMGLSTKLWIVLSWFMITVWFHVLCEFLESTIHLWLIVLVFKYFGCSHVVYEYYFSSLVHIIIHFWGVPSSSLFDWLVCLMSSLSWLYWRWGRGWVHR